jgi:hypothetical protein
VDAALAAAAARAASEGSGAAALSGSVVGGGSTCGGSVGGACAARNASTRLRTASAWPGGARAASHASSTSARSTPSAPTHAPPVPAASQRRYSCSRAPKMVHAAALTHAVGATDAACRSSRATASKLGSRLLNAPVVPKKAFTASARAAGVRPCFSTCARIARTPFSAPSTPQRSACALMVSRNASLSGGPSSSAYASATVRFLPRVAPPASPATPSLPLAALAAALAAAALARRRARAAFTAFTAAPAASVHDISSDQTAKKEWCVCTNALSAPRMALSRPARAASRCGSVGRPASAEPLPPSAGGLAGAFRRFGIARAAVRPARHNHSGEQLLARPVRWPATRARARRARRTLGASGAAGRAGRRCAGRGARRGAGRGARRGARFFV